MFLKRERRGSVATHGRKGKMKAEAETECCDRWPRAASHQQQLEEAKNRLSSETLEGL